VFRRENGDRDSYAAPSSLFDAFLDWIQQNSDAMIASDPHRFGSNTQLDLSPDADRQHFDLETLPGETSSLYREHSVSAIPTLSTCSGATLSLPVRLW
jgi:hypothetical protein